MAMVSAHTELDALLGLPVQLTITFVCVAAHGWLHQVLHAKTIRETSRWGLEAQQLQMRNDEAVGLFQACGQRLEGAFWCGLWAIQETHACLGSRQM
jgi:hypothetical protein